MRTEAYTGETLCLPSQSKEETEQREIPAQTIRHVSGETCGLEPITSRWALVCVSKHRTKSQVCIQALGPGHQQGPPGM